VTGSQNVTVVHNEMANVTFNNAPCEGEIEIFKEDEATGELLGGACFNITPDPTSADLTGTLEVCDNDSNDADATNGTIRVENVTCGNYTITESSAPLGYVIATGSQNVTVVHNSTENVTFNNTPCEGEIEIKKFGEDTGELLGGACFNITPDPTSADLTGTLEVCDNDGNDADATNGTIKLENVPCGNYNITETKAPPGYVISSTKSVTVVYNEIAGTEFINTAVCKGEIEIKKFEGRGCTPGYWKNHLEDWPPTGYEPDQIVSSVFTVPTCVDELAGDTLLEALEYPGGDGTVGAARILLRAAVAAVLNAAYPDVNYPRTVGEVINAVNNALASCDRDTMLSLAADLDRDNNLGCPLGEPLDGGCSGYLGGACFNITPNPYAASPATLTVCDNQANDSNSTAGVILLANVPCGNYTITEHSAPPGYVIVTGSQNVTVTGNQTETVEFTNTRTPCTGEIEIYKEDESTGELLGGACFNITPDPTSADLTGTLEVCDNDANDADATNGTIRVENVTCGNYTITESSAPPGYVIVTGSQNVTVTGNQTETVEFTNTRISRAAIKVDKTAALYGEGCTPGYWKNHLEDWPEVYNASQNVSSVFNVSSCVSELAGDTLLQALEYPGGDGTVGAAQILLRAAVAAVLNAENNAFFIFRFLLYFLLLPL
ncbi:collagen binding domain-containing protein, partial [Chloroflexota bacterium]